MDNTEDNPMNAAPLSNAEVLFDGTFTSPRLDHAESVAVAEDGALWCGGEQGQVFRIDGGQIELIASTGGFILGLGFLDSTTLALCDIGAPAVWLLDTPSRKLTQMDPPEGHVLLTPNAVVALPDGSFLVTDSGIAHTPQPGILRYQRGGSSELWLDRPINFANGLALSPDYRTLYVAQSWSYNVLAVDIESDGCHPGTVKTYAESGDAIPDGLCVDDDGALYVGCYEPSRVLYIPQSHDVRVLADDPTAHTLCHPTGVVARATDIVVANLGRWHLSTIPRPAKDH